VELTLVTWNLKGSEGPDLAAVADHLAAAGADLVVLQEVQRRQARAVARRLGATSSRWGFKHWPVRTWAEGMAVLGVSRPARVRTRALSFRFRPWSWRRRIYQLAVVDLAPSPGVPAVHPPLTLVNAHLSPHARAAMRTAEVETVATALGAAPGPIVVAGDLNDDPGADFFARLTAAGLRDAWDDAAPPGKRAATNWRGWRRGTTDEPSRRLDYVLVSGGVRVVRVDIPRPGDEGFARFAGLSDHLPVAATVAIGD
jgi:endonuclease/exonuclease/phosphatase family metal-dependent hydrolase